MLRGKSLFCSHLVAAMLSVTIVAAQNTQPRREPDVPFVPTTDEAVLAMLKLADVKKTDVVYDLGCGDGRIVITAAKNLGARGVGIDINPVRIGEAKANAKRAGVENMVRFEENADQLVRQPADQLRGTPGHGRQHEPPPFPDRIFDPSWRYAAAAGATGLYAVAGL